MKSVHEHFLLHLIVCSMLTMTIAFMWDGWWHLAIGRDNLFIPPHILLYSAVGFTVLAGIYGWWKFKQQVWKKIAIVLLVIPTIAPIDNLWHLIYGIENFSSPLVIWSPPHLAGILAIIVVFVILLKFVLKEKNKISQRFFGGLILAAILSFLYVLVAPLYPTGPYHVLGYWGSGVISFFIIGLLLIAHRILPGIGGAIDVTLYGIGIMVVSPLFGEQLAKGVVIPIHTNPPNWILNFGFLVPAVIIDFFGKFPKWLVGAVSGGAYSLILYGVASIFLEWNFRFSPESILISAISAVVGGFLAGFILEKQKYI